MTRPTPERVRPGRSALAVLLVVMGSAIVAVAASAPGGWTAPGLPSGGDSGPARLAGATAVVLGLVLLLVQRRRGVTGGARGGVFLTAGALMGLVALLALLLPGVSTDSASPGGQGGAGRAGSGPGETPRVADVPPPPGNPSAEPPGSPDETSPPAPGSPDAPAGVLPEPPRPRPMDDLPEPPRPGPLDDLAEPETSGEPRAQSSTDGAPVPPPALLSERTRRLLLLALLAVASVMWIRALRRRPAQPVPADPEPPPAPPVAAGDAEAGLRTALDQLLRRDGDPRIGILAAYRGLLADLSAAGAPYLPQEAPHEYLRRVLRELGLPAGPLHRLADLYVLAQFGDRPVTEVHRGATAATVAKTLAALRDREDAPDGPRGTAPPAEVGA